MAEEHEDADAKRQERAFEIRRAAALAQQGGPRPIQRPNGDERLYENKIGNFSKGLRHDEDLGEVHRDDYDALLRAVSSQKPKDFEAIPLAGRERLLNPQAGLAFLLEGRDSHVFELPPAPEFSSAEEAGEMAELYWQALTRDVAFSAYDTHSLTQAAADDLSRFSDFGGPKGPDGRSVIPRTLFRAAVPGGLSGPYLSQFLWLPVPSGAALLPQRYPVPAARRDHLTSFQAWRENQCGASPGADAALDRTPRFIRTGRDLGRYVHKDFTYQAFLNATLILLGWPERMGRPVPLAAPNPYHDSTNRAGFATFGGPHVLDLVARVANAALKAAWYQKWFVHRRLRPDAFGARVHLHRSKRAKYPIHEELLRAAALDLVHSRHRSYLLPMAYPEGSPLHPAYPAGHAAIAGACATVLKAFFNELEPIPDPVVATADGLGLSRYSGDPLTVGGELNKLAANIAIGRNAAGVHWRSDAIQGLYLGEAVAIGILKDQAATFHEAFPGFSLTRFDNIPATV
jgi:membrane-associated phospholipid phosphatase